MTYHFETRAIHDGQHPDRVTGAVIPPIHLSSTFQQEEVGKHLGYEYSRTNNPTRERLEHQIASLEGVKHGIAFSSGSAATSTIMLMLTSGDHVICGDDVYGGTYRFFDKVMTHFGLEFDFADLTNADNLSQYIRPSTKLVWLESPTNPLLKITDISRLTEIAKESGLLTVVDNTFATPFLQQPFELGADLVVHSSTKYLGGHSDVVGGIVVTDDDMVADKLRFLQNSAGAVPSPFDCWMVSKGVKTLSLRMERHCSNTEEIVSFLSKRNEVQKIYYPFLETHPNHEIAAKQMRMGGGMLSFELASATHAKKFLKELKIFTLAESLGGIESLAEYPPEMTHGSIERGRRHEIGINDGLVRLSVGIENVTDLIEDITQALDSL